MARCLLVGCGCRGRSLASALAARGHVVRGTTRQPQRLQEIEAAGAEAVLADPDRIATLVPHLDHVGVVALLWGSAAGPAELVSALHGPRLEALMLRVLDTTVRGVLYESVGTVSGELLSRGAEAVTRACEASHVPFSLLAAEPDDPGWARLAVSAVESLL